MERQARAFQVASRRRAGLLIPAFKAGASWLRTRFSPSARRGGVARPGPATPSQTLGADDPAPPLVCSGGVVKDYDVSDQYPGAVTVRTPALSILRGVAAHEAVLTVFEAENIAVSTCYVPIDTERRWLFINQTYEGVLHHWAPRPKIQGDQFDFQSASPIVVTQKAVLIGGAVERNYYHWLMNWLARIVTLKVLAPQIYADETVHFLIDRAAQSSNIMAFLDVTGIDPSRFIWIDHANDYLVRQAVLVSFGSRTAYHPEMMAPMREMFLPLARRSTLSPRRRRLWISRQSLGPQHRRIDNYAEIEPILQHRRFEVVVLEALSVADQMRLFSTAEAIGGVHGAGLVNMIFSPPDCKVLSLESDLNLRLGASNFYSKLAQACGLDYRHVKVGRAPSPPGAPHTFPNAHNADVVVSAKALERAFEAMFPEG